MLLTTKDMQASLHLGRDRAYALMRSSGFPSIKIGGRYYVDENELQKWIIQYSYKCYKL